MRRRELQLGIAAGSLAALAAGIVVGAQALTRYFVRRYYHDNYAPIALDSASVGDFPPQYHLADVPWFATANPYCGSTALRMAAAQRGREVARDEVDFLMGFTYGAGPRPTGVGLLAFLSREVGFFPFTDPEAGGAVAAPFLGLTRRFYVTNNAALYLRGLRHYLAAGYAVRVPLDMAALYPMPGPLPHHDLLVGYDEAGFYYYETVCAKKTPCEPGERPPGERGLFVPEGTLLAAVASLAKLFAYPWHYCFCIYDGQRAVEDLRPIWERNGRLLVGGAAHGPAVGADAVEATALAMVKRGRKVDLPQMRFALKAAAYTRRDNAAFLRRRFAGEADAERTAALMDRAADAYERASEIASVGLGRLQAREVAAALHEAAAAEREVGRAFLARST